ncbi:MAG TPA: uridine diphosphate-N-acetylglucosamine-binding protein YvcK, partial [Actinoplanes sp.]|nr:uridine diphosphate-N-acetylglucosamine-binding protein YvcK [Actinoplanes sp.]
MSPLRVVAFGGGHGLSASLRALRGRAAELNLDITAIVTVGDDGGSSGRLLAERDALLPPGDLRQALAALADEQAVTQRTANLLQYRFAEIPAGGEGPDPLVGHAVGNLLLLGLMEMLGDPVQALDHAAAMVGARGRVLPMARHAIGIEADMRGADPQHPHEIVTVRGQHAVAVAHGHVEAVRIEPADPPVCAQAVAAIEQADWLIFGPGSWFTSVLPHLMVPGLA